MSKEIVKKSNSIWWEEVIDTPEAEIVEENFYVEEAFVKNKNLIRMDLNIVQFPIFSKNTKRKVNQIIKYYFNKNRDTYITVKPAAGDYVPGETEEKVFIALMQIMKEKGMPKKFIVTSTELRDKLKIGSNASYGSVVKNSLLRLAETNYNFKNTMYSSEKNGVIKEEVSTPILSLRIITLSLKENSVYREQVQDKRIKEIYEINISDHFYKNIIQKGYMVYNSEILLDINTSTARTIYMLVEKLRFDNLYLKIDSLVLIKRIPLKYDRRNISHTIKTLEKAFNELKNKKLIKDFRLIKDSTWEKSEIEIIFSEKSKDEKQQRFFEDRNDFRTLLTQSTISGTEHEMIDDAIVTKTEEITVTSEMVRKILELMPKKALELKTIPRTIKEAIEQYGYVKVESVAKYMRKNKVEKIRAYFLKALEKNWVEDEEVLVKMDIKQNKSSFVEKSTDVIPEYNESLFKAFEKLTEEVKNGVEGYVYQEYVKKCGMNTKIQKIAFAGSRKKYICEFLEKHPEILIGDEPKQTTSITEESVQDVDFGIEKIKEMILESLELGSLVYSYTDEEKKALLLKIIRQVLVLKNKGFLTLNKLNEIIEENLHI